VTGRLQRNPRGFGFVTPDGGGRDVFIPPHGLGDLMDGDRVAIRVGREDREGRSRGEIVRVVERSRRPVLGVYRSQGGPRGPGYVEAYDRLYETPILIPEGEAGPARNGMVVGVMVTRPASEGRRASGRVVEMLGDPDEPGTDLKAIIRKHDLREEFPPEVRREAEPIPDEVPAGEAGRREDFRDLPIVTIDGETAMDFDDAVSRLPDGARQVFVLHDVEGYKHDEIADMLGIVAGTSKSQLHHARMALRKHLDR